MQVVYSPAHLAHDITSETFMGLSIPANEVAERAERIRDALTADGGFQIAQPTDHGESAITAVHDAGLVRFLEVAWSELRRQGISRPFLSADTYPNRSMFEACPTTPSPASSANPFTPGVARASGASIPQRRSSPGRTSRHAPQSMSRSP